MSTPFAVSADVDSLLRAANLAAMRALLNVQTFRDLEDETATLTLADANNVVVGINSAADQGWIIPTNDDAAFPLGTVLLGRNFGPGHVYIVGSDGSVTINSSNPVRVASISGTAWAVLKTGTNEWLLSPLPAGRFNLGNVDGSTALDISNGQFQTCVQIDDTVFNAPSGGEEGDWLNVLIQWANSTYDLNFDSAIRRTPDMDALLPITLVAFRSYLCSFVKRGGVWCISNVDGPCVEVVD